MMQNTNVGVEEFGDAAQAGMPNVTRHRSAPVCSRTNNVKPPHDESTLSRSDIRRNMLFVILLDTIWITGYQDFTVALQPLLVYLQAPNKLIGFVLGATWLALPGMFLSVWITRRFRIKKWYLFVVNIPYMGVIGSAGALLLMAKWLDLSNAFLLVVTVGAVLAQNFLAGFVALPHNEYVAACIPATHRGRYTGISTMTGAILSVLSASVGAIILKNIGKPMSFGYLFLMTWAICQGGYWFAVLAKERPTPVESSPKPWSKDMLRAFWRDKPYVRFLIMWIVPALTYGPVMGFLMTYGMKELHMQAYVVATLYAVNLVVRAVCSAPSGAIVDKYGAKKVIPILPVAYTLIFVMLFCWRNVWAVYIGSAVAMGVGVIVGGPAKSVLQYGIPKPEDRAGHFTIQMMSDYLVAGLGMIVSGFLLDAIAFRTAFGLAAICAVLYYPVLVWLMRPLPDKVEDYS